MEQETVSAAEAVAEVVATDVIVQSLGIYGLAIVISVIMAVSIRAIVAILAAAQRQRAPAPKPAVAGTAAASAAVEDGIPADDVAAIAAAVATVFTAHRIVHIQPLQDSHAWATEGRWQHQTSHSPSRHHL